MKIDIIKIPLQPYTRFHFGDFRLDEKVALGHTSGLAHSDLVFSALINAYSEKNADTDNFIQLFLNDKIKLSSLFYYLQNETESIYLLPKPVFLDLYSPRDKQHKKRNRIAFISQKVWQQGLNPGKWITGKGKAGDNYTLIQDGNILLTKQEADAFGLNDKSTVFYEQEHPNSPIRKQNNESIFYETDLHIGKIDNVKIGFYLMYQSEEEEKNKLLQALNILRYSGIGGNRTVMGRTMIDNLDFDTLEFKGDKLTNVSLINPKDENELKKIEYFKTMLRGGTVNVKVVRMVKEGALLNDNITGQIPVIGTDICNNPLYRYGKAFTIPCSIIKTQTNEETC